MTSPPSSSFVHLTLPRYTTLYCVIEAVSSLQQLPSNTFSNAMFLNILCYCNAVSSYMPRYLSDQETCELWCVCMIITLGQNAVLLVNIKSALELVSWRETGYLKCYHKDQGTNNIVKAYNFAQSTVSTAVKSDTATVATRKIMYTLFTKRKTKKCNAIMEVMKNFELLK